MKNFPPFSVKGFFFTLLLGLMNIQVSAQSDTISAVVLHDAESLIRDFFLAGNCIEVFNFQLSGEFGQAGVFTNGMTSIGLDEGIVLSTGNVLDITGPNDDSETSTLYSSVGQDIDLETLDTIFTGNSSARTLSDIVILEFDFTPTVEMASFDFVFASEEYCYYSLTSFIDIFGFFVSGPGLDGPYTNNGINIALVPGTQAPITAFSINDFNNPEFFCNNTLGTGFDALCTGVPNPVAPDFIEFDGFTKPLVASFPVIPCETYHVKLAITDTTDDILDSAVFLKAQSFIAGRTSNISSDIIGQSEDENSPYEGCGSVDVIFSRADLVDTSDLVVYYDILPSSNATPGVDFTALPDSIVIPAGIESDTFHIDFFADNINEGNEFFTIKLRNPCSCAESEITFTIIDPIPISGIIEGMDEVCIGDALELIATPTGGFGEIHYEWPNSNIDSIYNVVPDSGFNHQLIMTDDCFQSDTIDFFVDVLAPEAFIDGNGVICDGLPDFSYFVELTGGTSFSFDILQGGMTTSYNDITVDTFWIPTAETGIFQVINAFTDGCPAETDGFAQALVVDIMTQVAIDSINCFEANDAIVAIRPNGGDGFYSYDWSHDNTLQQDTAFNLGVGTYEVYISDVQGCLDTVSFTLDQPPLFSLQIDTIRLEADCMTNGSLLAVAEGGVIPYTYNWSNGIMTALNEDLSPNTYMLTVTDINNCSEEREVIILDNGDLPIVELFASDSLDCNVSSVNLTTGNSSIGSSFVYIWTNTAGDTLLLGDPQNWDTNSPGTYTLEITDTESTCSSSASIVITENNTPPPALILRSLITIDCYQPISNLFSQEASQDWTADWYDNDADTLIVSNQWNVDVFSGGNYELVVTNMFTGCVSRDTTHINQEFNAPIAIIPLPDSLTCTSNEVTLMVDIETGSGSYNYEWSGPTGGLSLPIDQATATATQAGDYQLVLFDTFNGCSDTLTTTVILDVASLALDPLTDTTLTCLVEEIILIANSPAGGTLEYTWLDSDDTVISNTASISITQIGNYTINVTDTGNDCTQSLTIIVDGDYDEPSIATNIPDSLDCVMSSVNISAESVLGQSANWLNSIGETLAENTWSYSASDPGTYQVLVTNEENGCFSVEDIVVEIDTLSPIGIILEHDELTCEEDNLNLEIEATQGSGDYSYSWSGPINAINGSAVEAVVTINNNGTYWVTLTDNENGCTNEFTTEVTKNGDFPEIDIIQDTLINCYNPIITIEATSSTVGNLSYQWFDENEVAVGIDAVLNASEAGVYDIQLTDNSNNCISIFSLTVGEDFIPPTANAGEDAFLDCINENTLLSAVEGDMNWTPSWFDPDGVLLSTGEWTYTASSAGVYELIVFDNQNGCDNSDIAVVSIDVNVPIANAGVDVLMDCFSNLATIDASASSNGSNISYALYDAVGALIQDGVSSTFSVDQIGSYQLIVTNNDNSCTAEDIVLVEIETPEVTKISIVNAFCFGQEGSLIIEKVVGGIPPYLYSIDGGESYQISNIFTNLQAGVYPIMVQDINGCIGETTSILNEPEELLVVLPAIINLAIGDSIILDPLINRDTTGLTMSWSNSDQLNCLACLNPQFNAFETQLLELTITDEGGCETKEQVLIIVDRRIPVYIPNAFSPHNGDGTNDNFIIYGNTNQVKEVLSLSIFDRWGNMTFTANNFPLNSPHPSHAWDGTFNGEPLNSGVFIYVVEILLITGEKAHFEGEILLMD